MNDDSIKSFRTYEHFFCLEENLPLHKTEQVFLAGPFCIAENSKRKNLLTVLRPSNFLATPHFRRQCRLGKTNEPPAEIRSSRTKTLKETEKYNLAVVYFATRQLDVHY